MDDFRGPGKKNKTKRQKINLKKINILRRKKKDGKKPYQKEDLKESEGYKSHLCKFIQNTHC
jgi:hypothetical protein